MTYTGDIPHIAPEEQNFMVNYIPKDTKGDVWSFLKLCLSLFYNLNFKEKGMEQEEINDLIKDCF